MKKQLLLLSSSLLLLSACADVSNQDRIRAWVDENTRGMRGQVDPLPEIQPYEPVPYEVEDLSDPFDSAKLEAEIRARKMVSGANVLQPDFEAREVRNSLLERYPLEDLKMIGMFHINNEPIAVIKVDNSVQQVRLGDYIGTDFGRIVAIQESEIDILELVQDPAGDWTERESVLFLQTWEGPKE